MISPALHQRVMDKIAEGMSIARSHYGITMAAPRVVYQKRGTTAGTADYVKWEIDLNAALFQQNIEEFLKRTVVHELAHLIHHVVNPEDHNPRYGKRDVHGTNWQNVMRVLGGPTERCHSYDVSSVKQHKTVVRHLHKCTTCGEEVEVGAKHHAAIQKGVSTIYHRKCGRHSRFLTSSFTVVKSPTGVVTPATPNKSSTPLSTPATGSKLARCYEIYKLYGLRVARAQMIAMFVNQCDCTVAGASTYYQTCKKMYESGTP